MLGKRKFDGDGSQNGELQPGIKVARLPSPVSTLDLPGLVSATVPWSVESLQSTQPAWHSAHRSRDSEEVSSFAQNQDAQPCSGLSGNGLLRASEGHPHTRHQAPERGCTVGNPAGATTADSHSQACTPEGHSKPNASDLSYVEVNSLLRRLHYERVLRTNVYPT